MNGALSISYTLFPDVLAKECELKADIPWLRFVERIQDPPTYLRKDACALISLAEFGNKPSANGCIRHAGNVLRVYGVECDYDDEKIPLSTAVSKLQAAHICGVFYTSASHTPDNPRWRCLLPMSEPCAPQHRKLFAARANRVFGGMLSRETFTLSQSFYIGRVRGAPYETAVTSGRTIDLAADIAPLFCQFTTAGTTTASTSTSSDRDARTDAELRAAFDRGDGRYDAMLKLSARLASRGRGVSAIESELFALLGRESRNASGVDLSTRVIPLARSAVAKYGRSSA